MKPFKLTVAVDKDGKSNLKIEGPGRVDVTQGQIITYLAGELEKYELNIAMENIGRKVLEEVKKTSQGIQLVKDLPQSLKIKQ